MKIITLEDQTYEIEVSDEDKVIKVKEKLSPIVNLGVDNIGLVYENRILYDDTLIKEYKIDPEEFVLICSISSKVGETEEQMLLDKTDSASLKLVTKDEASVGNKTSLMIYIKHLNIRKTHFVKIVSSEIIFYVFQKYFDDMRYLYFTFNDSPMNLTLRFSDYNFVNGSIVFVENLLDTGLKDFINLRIFPLNNFYHSFSTFGMSNTKIGEIRMRLSKHINMPMKNIVMYQEQNEEQVMGDDEELGEIQTFYYDIHSDFEDIIKRDIIGRGAFGSVYQCSILNSHRDLALKEFKFSESNLKEISLYSHEIEILCSLGTHDRIVQFERRVMANNSLYILMEYMPGGSLKNYLKARGPLSEIDIVRFSQQILEALQYLHNLSIVHRDVKGDNVLLDASGNAKLCDFSVSKILIKAVSKGFLKEGPRSFVGTANWMAPEIINGKIYGPKADIWSFGATVIEMLTGKPPYFDLGYYAVIFKVGLEKKIDFDVPLDFKRQFKSFLDSCLQSNPSQRLSADDLLQHPFLFDGSLSP